MSFPDSTIWVSLPVFESRATSDITPTFKRKAGLTTQHELTNLGSRKKDRLVIAFFADLRLNGCPSESHSYVSRRGLQRFGSSETADLWMVSEHDVAPVRSPALAPQIEVGA